MPELVEARVGFDDIRIPERIREGFEQWLSEQQAPEEGTTFSLGMVVKHDRGFPLVVTDSGAYRAEHEIALVKNAPVRAAIGDWACLRVVDGHEKVRIMRILPREGIIARHDPRGHEGQHILAVNVDALLVAVALSEGKLDERGIMHAVVIGLDAGVEPVVVLTKTDRKKTAEHLAADIERVRELVGADVEVLVTSSVTGEGIEAVRERVDEESIAAIMGVSGAGKSTLLNELLGEESLPTSEVRARDDAGRHTTVAREIVSIPGGGLIIDTPGVRSLSIRDHEDGVLLAFPEIVDLAATCKFRDCTHTDEPGCSVLPAVEAGDVSGIRLRSYQRMQEEMRTSTEAIDPALLSRKRRR